MQPLTVVLGIVLGSLFSVAFGLGVVLVIFGLRQNQDARFAAELPELLRATILFTIVTLFSVMAFVGSLRATRWRHWALLLLGASLAGVGWYYWPA